MAALVNKVCFARKLAPLLTCNDQEDNPVERYIKQEKIGEGSVADIYKAYDQKANQWVALKKMQLTPQNIKLIASEIRIMKVGYSAIY